MPSQRGDKEQQAQIAHQPPQAKVRSPFAQTRAGGPHPTIPSKTLHDHLVTIETQREQDLLTGDFSERIFLKMYVAARTSGLLATIPDRDWKTLCTLATYMDSDGYCYPSQSELAKALGCSRQMANERIGSLANFKFHGHPVLFVEREKRSSGQWERNRYKVLPIANLAIFGDEHAELRSSQTQRTTVSSELDTAQNVDTMSSTMSSATGPARLDTNKNQLTNNTKQHVVVVDVLKTFGLSVPFARRLAKNYPEPFILQKLDLVQWLLDSKSPLVTRNPAGYLRRAIEEDYVPPPGYKTKAQLSAEEEKRTLAIRAAQEDRLRLEEELAKVKEEAQRKVDGLYPASKIAYTDLTTETAWNLVLEQLKEQMSKANFETWVKETTLLSVESDVALIAAGSRFQIETLESRLDPMIRKALSSTIQRPVQCRYEAISGLIGLHNRNGGGTT